MKTYQLALASIMTALLVTSCSKPEREPEAVPKNQATFEKPAGQPSEIAQKVGEISQAVVENTVDKTIKITGKTAEKVEKAKEVVIETTDKAVTKTEEVVKKTETTTKKVSQQVIEKTAAVDKAAVKTTIATMDKAEVLVEKTAEALKPAINSAKTSAPLKVPETITLENKKGKITVSHKKHSTTFACKQCHGDATPGPMELGQEKGHSLCKGCHQEKGAGPTDCNGCHEKKAMKQLQGC